MCLANQTTAACADSSLILVIWSVALIPRRVTALVGRIGRRSEDERQRQGPAGSVTEQGEQLGVPAPW